MTEKNYRCGFVAVIGRPNVGKSTLVNALVGDKVSIVTPKPQTTRHRILGVHSDSRAQTIYVDTPGLHQSAGKAMNRLMNKTAVNALTDADVALFVVEAQQWTEADAEVLRRLQSCNLPVLIVLNKIDKVSPKQALLQVMAETAQRHEFAEIIPAAALKGDNVDLIARRVVEYLPASPPLFPTDARTDRSLEFRISEVIREKLTLVLRQEIPYGLTVQLEKFDPDARPIAIYAVIWVERDSQKGIVVGKEGALLKKVGRAARLELKDSLGAPVHIELWVKVKANWADNEKELLDLGF